jgi:predicted PurR-regulated permease PerM
MVDQQQYHWPLFRRFLILCLGVGTVMLLLTYLYRSVMIGFMTSAVISYISSPGINYLCERLPIRRKTLVGVLIILVVTFCSFGAFFGIPYIYQELLGIVQMIPDAISYAERLAKPLIEWARHSKIVPDETIEAGFRKLNLLQHLMGATDTMEKVFSRTPKLLEAAFNLAMVPLFSYLMLAEKDDIRGLVKTWTPEDLHPLLRVFVARIDKVLRAVVKGQFLVAFVLSIFYMAGFSLIDLPSGLAIGAIAGVCRVVPYLDVVVGVSLAIIVILTQGGGLAVFLGVLIVVAVVQSLDGVIITPRIIGDRAGLHPIVVIASVFSFGSWFGLLGILLAVPIVAASVVALQICLPYLRNSPFYRQPPS